jgi:glutamyl-Q tRNA(Asp) synthetase
LLWDGPVRKQSEHFDDYRHTLDRLEAIGVLYPCFCTRREIREEIARSGGAPQGEGVPIYPGTCRDLDPGIRTARITDGADYALRLNLSAALARTGPLDWSEDGRRIAAQPELLGDVVLAGKDVPASYHLAVTLDDALQGVTLVTRGADLFTATHIHRLLQALLGLPTPVYRHHPLLIDSTGRRFAKRDRALTIRAMRAAGMTSEQIIADAQSSGR